MLKGLVLLAVMAAPDGGAERIVLKVGETHLIDAPSVARMSVSGKCFDVVTFPGGKLLITGLAPGACTSTLVVHDAAGRTLSWPVEVLPFVAPSEVPDQTRLHVGDTVTLAASAIKQVTTSDKKVVTVAIGQDGAVVTALAPGAATVRVETRDGPIAHRFEVQPNP